MPPFWRRRAPARAADPWSVAPVTVVPCSEPGCAGGGALACAFVDRRQRGCGTAWCSEHGQIVAGRVYCKRHAGVQRALSAADNTSPPDLDDRAASLLTWVAAAVEARLSAALDRHRRPDEELLVQSPRSLLLGARNVRVRAWERSWKLARHTGLGHWVSLQVAEGSDDEVVVVVDGVIAARLVPPWIVARRSGLTLTPESDAVQRRAFDDAIVAAVERALLQEPALPH